MLDGVEIQYQGSSSNKKIMYGDIDKGLGFLRLLTDLRLLFEILMKF